MKKNIWTDQKNLERLQKYKGGISFVAESCKRFPCGISIKPMHITKRYLSMSGNKNINRLLRI